MQPYLVVTHRQVRPGLQGRSTSYGNTTSAVGLCCYAVLCLCSAAVAVVLRCRNISNTCTLNSRTSLLPPSPFLLLASSHFDKYSARCRQRGELCSDTSPNDDCLVCGGYPVNAIGITETPTVILKFSFFFLFVDTCIAKPHHGFGSISRLLPCPKVPFAIPRSRDNRHREGGGGTGGRRLPDISLASVPAQPKRRPY